MLHPRAEAPVGIDVPISKLQRDFYERMRGDWGLGPDDWECFPRVYRNRLQDGYAAEAQFGVRDYRDVYQDDAKAVTSFYGVGQKTTAAGSMLKAPVHLVLFTNLARLKPNAIDRADEQVRTDVVHYFGDGACWGFELTEIITGVEACLEEYPGTRRKQLLTRADMHPHHIFRCNLSLTYQP